MGGPGSGRRKKGELLDKDTDEFVRQALQLGERAAPRAMQNVVDRGEKGELSPSLKLLGMVGAQAPARVNVSGTVAHLVMSPEQYALLNEAVDVEWKQIE